MPEWISTEEATDLSGYRPAHIGGVARQGKIGAEKQDHDWWNDREKLRVYLAMVEALGSKKYAGT